jgi:NADPH:quinone reductase-like Zn-dependent oxidoreductase
MQGWRYDSYGGPEVLRFVEDLPEPSPGPGEVVVQVHALALNPKDVLVRKGKLAGLPTVRLPIVPGHDLAGVVVQAGPGADLAVGQAVFGWYESLTGGASQARVAMPARWLAPMPPGLGWEGAAAIPLAALTALQALRDELALRRGERLLINGASGGVGVYAVQIARRMGAHVTAVCSSANEAMVRELGADVHVDYTRVDPLELREVDAFFDVFGNKPWNLARRTLSSRGRYCTTLPRPRTLLQGMAARVGLSRAHLVIVRSRRADLEVLARWIEEGVLRPVIDRVLDWRELPAGHLVIESKRARGKVVLAVPTS